jgi:hypothetical protein
VRGFGPFDKLRTYTLRQAQDLRPSTSSGLAPFDGLRTCTLRQAQDLRPSTGSGLAPFDGLRARGAQPELLFGGCEASTGSARTVEVDGVRLGLRHTKQGPTRASRHPSRPAAKSFRDFVIESHHHSRLKSELSGCYPAHSLTSLLFFSHKWPTVRSVPLAGEVLPGDHVAGGAAGRWQLRCNWL